jgi:superfamily II DNA or RNA helicase
MSLVEESEPAERQLSQEDNAERPVGMTSSHLGVEPGRPAKDLIARCRRLRQGIQEAATAPEMRRASAKQAFDALRDEIVREEIATMPLARIKETTQGRLRLGPIEKAGYSTVGAAAAAGVGRLQQIPGVGPHTASQVIGAARQLEAAMAQDVRVRFEPDSRTRLQSFLLAELYAYEIAQRSVAPISNDLSALAAELDATLGPAARASSRLRMFFSGHRKKEEAREALQRLSALTATPENAATESKLNDVLEAVRRPVPAGQYLWDDYEARAVAYNGLLIEIGEVATDVDASQGFVPLDIAQRVHQHPLDLSFMRASLRGYQAFGAKFALEQRRAILGDEMGLGKSVEALAALCHLHAGDQKKFLVVCPASVIVNWTREIQRHSLLTGYRLHGPDRDRNFRTWTRAGGVGVTTYEALRSMPKPQDFELDMLVVDEAHYAKNPAAARTRAVQQWTARTGRVLFLTGTPMENKVEEFRTLVRHLRPDVAASIRQTDGMLGATHFRKAVSPVYLRRDQSDVLAELPPLIDTQEWVSLEGDALADYRDAVASGNFMAMRRAAYMPGTTAGSAKLRRLVEIVDEAASNGRKVVIFSFFRDVLDIIASALGTTAIGPLTGSAPPSVRQAMVDEFSARKDSTALVSQIQAGGVGLNIQAASVVILAEPQWKPTMEDQAVARCHRMGQVRTVDVYRLLAEDSVDQRMLDILATKAALFDEYARRSELKDISPDAVDISDLDATKEASSRAADERRIVEMERKRLRLEGPPMPRSSESLNG